MNLSPTMVDVLLRGVFEGHVLMSGNAFLEELSFSDAYQRLEELGCAPSLIAESPITF
jgi:hypothetical protein